MCAAHAAAFEFYVPTVQCKAEDTCEAVLRRRKPYKPVERESGFDYSTNMSEFYGL